MRVSATIDCKSAFKKAERLSLQEDKLKMMSGRTSDDKEI